MSDSTYLLGRDGLLAGLAKLLDGLLVVTEILLAADEDDWQTLAEVQDLRDPLLRLHMSVMLIWRRIRRLNIKVARSSIWCPANRETTDLLLNVIQGVGRIDSEADKDHVRIGVRERAETVVVLLASRIPESQLDMLAVNLDVGDIVLEDGGDVDLQAQMLARPRFGSIITQPMRAPRRQSVLQMHEKIVDGCRIGQRHCFFESEFGFRGVTRHAGPCWV